jgi:TolB-like protein
VLQIFAKWVILGLLIIILGGCAASSYFTLGQQNLENEAYEAALQNFVLAFKENPRDIETLRELGVTLYLTKDYKKAIKVLQHVFKQDTTDGRTIFYLGSAYEIAEDYSNAINIYKRYVNISSFRAIRSDIETRLSQVIKQQMAAEAKAILAQEDAIDPSSIPENSVAVLYFRNLGNKRGLDPLQKGLTDMMITDLSKVKRLKVVERARLQKLMEEMGLGQTGLVDESTAPRVGKLLGASTMVRGTFIDLKNLSLRVDAGLIQTVEQSSIYADHLEDKITNLFKMEKNLVFKVIDQLGIKLTQEERDEIQIIPTKNILAFIAYCKGLDYEDKGLYESASRAYQRAVKLDPKFFRANRNLSRSKSTAAGKTELKRLQKQYAHVNQKTKKPGFSKNRPQHVKKMPGPGGKPGPGPNHLMHLGAVQNQAFLPGIDARKPLQENNQSSFGNIADIYISVPLPPNR